MIARTATCKFLVTQGEKQNGKLVRWRGPEPPKLPERCPYCWAKVVGVESPALDKTLTAAVRSPMPDTEGNGQCEDQKKLAVLAP